MTASSVLPAVDGRRNHVWPASHASNSGRDAWAGYAGGELATLCNLDYLAPCQVVEEAMAVTKLRLRKRGAERQAAAQRRLRRAIRLGIKLANNHCSRRWNARNFRREFPLTDNQMEYSEIARPTIAEVFAAFLKEEERLAPKVSLWNAASKQAGMSTSPKGNRTPFCAFQPK